MKKYVKDGRRKMKIREIKEKICGALGWLSMVGGTLYGLWICFYTMFYGGIIQIVTGIQANLDAIAIATGACKVFLCELGFLVPFLLGLLIGSWFLDKSI